MLSSSAVSCRGWNSRTNFWRRYGMEQLVELIANAKRMTALTGAGIQYRVWNTGLSLQWWDLYPSGKMRWIFFLCPLFTAAQKTSMNSLCSISAIL